MSPRAGRLTLIPRARRRPSPHVGERARRGILSLSLLRRATCTSVGVTGLASRTDARRYRTSRRDRTFPRFFSPSPQPGRYLGRSGANCIHDGQTRVISSLTFLRLYGILNFRYIYDYTPYTSTPLAPIKLLLHLSLPYLSILMIILKIIIIILKLLNIKRNKFTFFNPSAFLSSKSLSHFCTCVVSYV